MGRGPWHYCGGERKDGGRCRVQMVNYEHCYRHRQWTDRFFEFEPRRRAPPQPGKSRSGRRIDLGSAAAGLTAHVVAGDLVEAVSDRIATYLGKAARYRLQFRAWTPEYCVELAAAAQRLYALRDRADQLVVNAIVELAAPRSSRFTRHLMRRLLAKFVTLPVDAKLVAVARGLLVIGVFKCLMLRGTGAVRCACLQVQIGRAAHATARQRIVALLQAGERDLKRIR